jgi:hypothetical protein
MRSRLLIPFFLLAAGCTGGSAPAPAASAPPATTVAAAPSPAGVSVSADIVMIDTAAPSLTLRDGDAPSVASPRPNDLKKGDRTIRVEPSAAASLAGLKAGDRVRVTCSPVQAVTTMEASPAAPAGSPAAGAAAPGATTSGGTAAAGGAPLGTTGSGLAQCDSIIAITPSSAQ